MDRAGDVVRAGDVARDGDRSPIGDVARADDPCVGAFCSAGDGPRGDVALSGDRGGSEVSREGRAGEFGSVRDEARTEMGPAGDRAGMHVARDGDRSSVSEVGREDDARVGVFGSPEDRPCRAREAACVDEVCSGEDRDGEPESTGVVCDGEARGWGDLD